MINDYIRREDVLKGQKTGTFANGICFEAKRCVPVDYIESIESADVIPVVHAYWIRHENADIICGYYVPSFECSQCGTWEEDDSDFCPNCGAKMDAQGEG